MLSFSVVAVAGTSASALEQFMASLACQTLGMKRLDIVLVYDESRADVPAVVGRWTREYPDSVREVRSSLDDLPSSRNAGIVSCEGDWITFCDVSLPLPANYFQNVCDTLSSAEQRIVLACTGRVDWAAAPAGELPAASGIHPLERLLLVPRRAACCFYRRSELQNAGLTFDPHVRSGFEDVVLTARYLLAVDSACIASVPQPPYVTLEGESSITDESWRSARTYQEAIQWGYLRPLQDAARTLGYVPLWLQRTVLVDLQRYFEVDGGERALTKCVTEAMAVRFHELVRATLEHVDTGLIHTLMAQGTDPEVAYALLSYKVVVPSSHVTLDDWDYHCNQVRLTYFAGRRRPSETFLADDVPVTPAHAKYRACMFFRRPLLWKRIVWLPLGLARRLSIALDGERASICVGNTVFDARSDGTVSVQAALTAFPAGQGGREPLGFGLHGLKARALRWLSQLAPVRRRYLDAWVLLDREDEADDNAEHLYRWIRRHHPEVNAWFLLSRSSSDWPRLSKEGFRLMPPGWRRKLLFLNCRHVVSSQPDFASAGFSLALYGDLMKWRFTNLAHGINQSDQSHWFNASMCDLFLTTSVGEYKSMVDDDTPYEFTTKEVKQTGFPRHDALLARADVAESDGDLILIMPTWRYSLTKQDLVGASEQGESNSIASTEYVRRWSELLRSPALRALAESRGQRVAFMPHPEAKPFLKAFDIPPHVLVLTKSDIGVQDLFLRSALMITDYSSVAFEMALICRPVVYYQFDRDTYFGEGHNWREGYFDYEVDGFGPISGSAEGVVAHVRAILDSATTLEEKYLQRIRSTFPNVDHLACERVFAAIRDMSPVQCPPDGRY